MTKAPGTSQGAMSASEVRERLLAQAAESEEFRARLLADPRATLREDYGIALPENLKVFHHLCRTTATASWFRVA